MGKGKRDFEKILSTLKKGGVIAVPTDTVYGLIADARNPKGIKRIFAIKERDSKKPTPIFIRNIPEAKKIAAIGKREERILKRIWPGKVTAVLKRKTKSKLDLKVTGKNGRIKTVALRIPNHRFLQRMLAKYPNPLAQTSANPSGKAPAKSGKEVLAYFQNQKTRPDIVIDGKVNAKSKPSTIIDLTYHKTRILREGAMTKKIKQFITQ